MSLVFECILRKKSKIFYLFECNAVGFLVDFPERATFFRVKGWLTRANNNCIASTIKNNNVSEVEVQKLQLSVAIVLPVSHILIQSSPRTYFMPASTYQYGELLGRDTTVDNISCVQQEEAQ